MLLAANVGVSIHGIHESQAQRASDFSVGEFKHLQQLMFFHGRESYRKNAYLLLYNFYKNWLMIFPQFWFGLYNGITGLFIYETYIF